MTNIWKIIRISKPLHNWLWGISFLILLEAILAQTSPIVVKFIVDQIEQQIVRGDGDINKLWFLAAIFFAANFMSILLTAFSQRTGDYISSRLGKFLTEKFYSKIFTLPQKYFDTELSGKIVNQLTRGILTIQDFISAATNFVLPALLQSFLTIFILAYFDKTIAMLAIAIFPIYIGISHYSTKKWGEREVEKNKFEDIGRGRIQEVITNIKLVKSFNNQLSELKFISRTYNSIINIYDLQSTWYHILNFIRNFGLEFILFLIVSMTFRNTFLGILSLGEMVLILQLLNQLRRPLFAMSFILERIQRAEAGSREYFSVMDLESTEKIVYQKTLKLESKPTIEFKNIDFAYDTGDQVLSNVSFRLDKQETVALVGHSGAGKSTIINLILKFYDPTTGEIYINNKPYSQLKHAQIRNNISLVFQDNELFSSTIRENVSYGMGKTSDKEIIKALKKANAYDFVKKLPKGIDSEIGERGVRLSGGQKQRIQIARAILRNAPILILDEATSSLDSKSEKLVQEALDQLFENRLVIIIAHRFSTIQNANRILVIDNGRIVDSGSSKTLAKKDGIYAELLRYQVEGNQKLLSQYEIY